MNNSSKNLSNRYRILAFVRDHPEGTTRREIRRAFPEISVSNIDTSLAFLRNENLVYNNKVMGPKGATWFPKTHEGVSDRFAAIASELIKELHQVHYAGQELHLAQRLQELFGPENRTSES